MPIIKRKFNFKLGADPEFVLTMQGRKVDAEQTMKLALKGKPGFKQATSMASGGGYEIEPYGNIGWDGASSTAEIRPRPDYEPQKIIDNLAGIFKEFIKNMKLCDMSTLSEFSSVGGHLHLEIPKTDHQWGNEKINKIHRQLASFYLPLLISENKTNLNIRLKQGYGSLGDKRVENIFKWQDGSEGYTFEFRCPSAEWLTTPKLANATIAYMGVVYNEILNHSTNLKKFKDIIYTTDKQGDALQTLAIMDFNILTESILKKAKKYIRTFDMYPDYKEEIEYLFNPKQVIKDKIKAEYNIAIGWNLIEKSFPKKSQILSSKKKIQGIAEKKNFDMIKGVVNINYNDDTNVAAFADSLKDRVAAFNWKLKNSYYLFGMRKGIEKMIAKNLKDEYLTGKDSFKTILDKNEMDKLFDKMNQKFNNNTGISRTATLDFATGKLKDMRESIILIGLPYNMRIKENIKPFLNFIWSLEKGDIDPKIKKEDLLLDDQNLPVTQRGEIYKILTKQNNEPGEEVIIDTGSQSLRNHQRVINEMIQNNEEIINNN